MARRIGTPGGTAQRPCVFFADAAEFGRWLEAHHDTETELWMGFYRKGHPDAGLLWEEAVREALCWGWIDSMAQGIDEHTRRQRWTPRKKGSIWSLVNVASVEELTAEGRMRPSGLAAFALRREDRTGVYASEQAEQQLSAAQESVLRADPAAAAFWGAAPAGYRKVVTHWVLSAKQQATRDRRLAQLVDDSAAGRLVPFQRYGETPRWVERAASAAVEARGGGAET